MAEPLTNINYRFEDIQRYLQGKMSSVEMHDIEKAALQDPFLADAIEGYIEADAATVQKHLNEINAGLLSKKRKSKVVAFNNKTRWLSIAAVIIIIAGISLISFFALNKSNNQNEIAQLKREQIADSSNAQSKDSNAEQTITAQQSTQQNNVAQNKPEEKKSFSASARKKEKKYPSSEDKSLQANDADVTPMAASPSQVNQDDEVSRSFKIASPSNQKNDSIQILLSKASGLNIATNTFSGKVIDENNDPVPFASIELNHKKQTITADGAGNFNIKNNDSALPVTISAIGFESKTVFIKPQPENTIILNKNDVAMNEVVVTALGYKKEKKQNNQSAIPVGGWQNFNNYVIKQLNSDTTKENFITGNDLVEIEFLIDNNGNPYNLKITKPLDDERNSKAIDILKSGPKWMNTSKNKKGKVSILF